MVVVRREEWEVILLRGYRASALQDEKSYRHESSYNISNVLKTTVLYT